MASASDLGVSLINHGLLQTAAEWTMEAATPRCQPATWMAFVRMLTRIARTVAVIAAL